MTEEMRQSSLGSQGTMVFHLPFVMNPQAKSASGIRPVKMFNAFKALGYKVIEVTGSHPERRRKMADLKRQVQAGLKIDFVYSEASTTPTGLGEKITLATSLTRDINFLRYLRQQGIKVGLFYRDIYWQFDEYKERVGQPYTALLRWRYRADLKAYRKAVDIIYLPSMRMAEFLPRQNQAQASALPPGAEIVESRQPETSDTTTLFYVGGIGSYYRMTETVRGVKEADDAAFIICTREGEWQEMKEQYEEVLGESIEVVHRHGEALEELYDRAHIGSLLMEPIPYRDFAAPMKLYEYLGHGKAIVATRGSLAAELVEKYEAGWTLDYDSNELSGLLDSLAKNPEKLKLAMDNAEKARFLETWQSRAQQVVAELT